MTAQNERSPTDSERELISFLSHEVKTPLTSAKLKLQLAMRTLATMPASPAKDRIGKMLADADRDLDRITAVIDKMRDHSSEPQS